MRARISLLIVSVFIISRASAQISTEALLDTIQHTAFTFFWQEANPANGLIRDRGPGSAPSSIASVGFGLSAICIGVDHGWVSRPAARDRVLTTLNTFWSGPQGGGTSGYIGNFGLFYHFLTMSGAVREWDSELSTIDTGLLLAGIIDAKQYFAGTDSIETRIRALADSIYYRMDWNYMRNSNAAIMMGWKPGTGFSTFGQWIGYNEAMIMYILALGSPTHPVDPGAWLQWTSGYRWQTHYGYSYINFPPLFGHQYSHCWIDYRNIADDHMRFRGITYFENSRRATLAQRAYSIANPLGHIGYSDSLWGITASDVQGGYAARGAPPAENDDGTIAPTAPLSSIPFAPTECLRVAHNLWNTLRNPLWGPYGFVDAFNLRAGWWSGSVIGIDQGPIIIMIENYRTGRVWQRFMANPDVQRGLLQANFQTVTDVNELSGTPASFVLHQNYPNPFNPTTTIRFDIPMPGFVSVKVYDVLGREVATLVSETMTAGVHNVSFDATRIPSGLYFYKLTASSFTQTKKMLVLK